MKRILFGAAAIALAAASTASAQEHRGWRGGDQQQQGGQIQGGRTGGWRGAQQQQQFQTQNQQPQAQVQQSQPQRHDWDRGGGRNWGGGGQVQRRDRDQGRNWADRGDRNDGRGYDRGYQRDHDGRGYQRGYERGYGNGRQYAWNAERRFRAGAYSWPRGYSYHRWSYGDILPGAFFASQYYLYDYYSYDLPPPPPGMQWVRVGSDALLIDQFTGQVQQVVYGIFW